jgi:serralysin
VENLTLSATYTQTGIGNALANRITGDNILNGGAGDDLLVGNGGKDTFIVAKGQNSDVIADFEPGINTIQLQGFGILAFSAIKVKMSDGAEGVTLALDGGETLHLLGIKAAKLSAADFGLAPESTVSRPAVLEGALYNAANDARLLLATGSPVTWRTGTDDPDTLTGDAHNNFLNSAGGPDTLTGGAGHDTYVVDRETGIVRENAGEGTDQVFSWATNFTLPKNVENLTISAAYKAKDSGNGLGNMIAGRARHNTLFGRRGNDLIDRGDEYDALFGENDNDVLIGGRGVDHLYGGAGRNLFVFRAVNEGGDIIHDFAQGKDIIDMSGLLTEVSFAGTNPLAENLLMLKSDASATSFFVGDGSGSFGAKPYLTPVGVNLVEADIGSILICRLLAA